MIEKMRSWAHSVPDLLQVRWDSNHWWEMALGSVVVVYSLISIFMGSIWSGGHGSSVTLEEKPVAFWICVCAYVVLGSWLLLYL
jgi:hypothetical protein